MVDYINLFQLLSHTTANQRNCYCWEINIDSFELKKICLGFVHVMFVWYLFLSLFTMLFFNHLDISNYANEPLSQALTSPPSRHPFNDELSNIYVIIHKMIARV